MIYLKQYLLPLVAGALLAFAYPNVLNAGCFIFAVMGYAIYYYGLFNSKNLIAALVKTLIFSLGFSIAGFYWLGNTLSTFGEISSIAGHITALFFSLIALPQLWIQSLFCYFILHNKKLKSYLIPLICLTHVLTELFITGQFPVWLGHSILTFDYNLSLVEIFGAGIYSYALILITIPFSMGKKNLNKHKLTISLGVILIIVDFFLGLYIKKPSALFDTSKEVINFRIVQANIGNFLKIQSERGHENSTEQVFNSFQELTLKPSEKPLDLIIWPETAIPTTFNTDYWNLYQFSKHTFMQKIVEQLPTSTALLFGGYDEGNTQNSANHFYSEYNTAFFYQNFTLQTYQKIKLIPFGETLPFGSLNQALAPYFPGVSLFSQGSHFTSFKLKNNYQFITPICYEILDTQFIRNFLQHNLETRFIVNLTNDSWYGDTAEPWQHLFLARWRTLEFRRPIIRSTNTGISTLIDENGKISNYLKVNDKNVLDLTLNLHDHPPTIYQHYGILPLLLFMLLASLLLGIYYKRQNRETTKKT